MKKNKSIVTVIGLLLLVLFFWSFLPSIPLSFAALNQTVLTKVNISNTEPLVFNVTITPSPVTLSPGSNTTVICNATVWDYNIVPRDITNVTAHLYLNTTSLTDTIKNDTHYFKQCTNVTQLTTMSAIYSCVFDVSFFAKNGTWNCNMTAIDTYNINTTGANITFIQSLIALNVSDVIDYGIVPVLNSSDERIANITNFGNTPINISVRGWGGENESLYANLSMVCELGNISIEYERYNTSTGQPWDQMINLTNADKIVPGLLVHPRNDTIIPINKTYWRIKIPAGVGGLCNGTVLFTASNI